MTKNSFVAEVTFNPFNSFQPSVVFHIETSHLICSATLCWNELRSIIPSYRNQLTGFYIMAILAFHWLPISCHWPLSMPPESIRKTSGFLMFSGISGMKWVIPANKCMFNVNGKTLINMWYMFKSIMEIIAQSLPIKCVCKFSKKTIFCSF